MAKFAVQGAAAEWIFSATGSDANTASKVSRGRARVQGRQEQAYSSPPGLTYVVCRA